MNKLSIYSELTWIETDPDRLNIDSLFVPDHDWKLCWSSWTTIIKSQV